MRRVFVVF